MVVRVPTLYNGDFLTTLHHACIISALNRYTGTTTRGVEAYMNLSSEASWAKTHLSRNGHAPRSRMCLRTGNEQEDSTIVIRREYRHISVFRRVLIFSVEHTAWGRNLAFLSCVWRYHRKLSAFAVSRLSLERLLPWYCWGAALDGWEKCALMDVLD